MAVHGICRPPAQKAMKIKRKQRLRLIGIGVVVLIVLIDIFYAYQRTDPKLEMTLSIDSEYQAINSNETKIQVGSVVDIGPYAPLNRAVDTERTTPVNVSARFRIPRILHQFWDTEEVPTAFAGWIKSWGVHHPDWTYYFWTDADVRKLLSKHYPHHLEMYLNYPGMLHKANAMRYYVLHHYGGVYADLDLEALRPMDTWLQGPQDCFLSLENYEHAYFHYQLDEPVVMNTLMACRPGHPFYAMVLDRLQMSQHFQDTLRSNGPFFLNHLYKNYSTASNTTSKYAVQALPPKYFLPTFDPVLLEKIQKACQFPHLMSAKEKLLCRELQSDRWRNRPSPEAYTDHHWVHVNHQDSGWKEKSVVYIRHLVPKATDMSKLF